MFHSICLLLRLPPFCDFQTAHQEVILVRLQRELRDLPEMQGQASCLREKSPALRVVFFPKNLAFPNPYLDGATETKTTDATGRRIKKMSDNREADKKF